jgi:nitric oxide reductase subunit B
MVLITLFPGGVLQMVDVVNNGYWHARSQAFLGGSLIKFIEWIRIVPDLIFGIAGVMPIVIAALLTYTTMLKKRAAA